MTIFIQERLWRTWQREEDPPLLFSAKNMAVGGLAVCPSQCRLGRAPSRRTEVSFVPRPPEIQAELIFLVGLYAAYSTWNKLSGFADFFSLMKI